MLPTERHSEYQWPISLGSQFTFSQIQVNVHSKTDHIHAVIGITTTHIKLWIKMRFQYIPENVKHDV